MTHPGHRILVVEDKVKWQKRICLLEPLASMLLEDSESVKCVDCLSDALGELAAHRYSLAVTDLWLETDHFEEWQLLADRLLTDGIPNIVYSGNVKLSRLTRWLNMYRIAGVFRKGDVDPIEFRNVVSRELEMRPIAPRPPRQERQRKSVLVVTALYEEMERVRSTGASSRFPIPLDWSENTLSGMDAQYWTARLDDVHDLVLVSPDSMGLTATASFSAAAFHELDPVLTAMLGICAGRYSKGVRLGHVIVPNQAFHYQFGARTKDGLEPEIRASNVHTKFTTGAQSIASDNRFDSWMGENWPAELPESRCVCHTLPMACSDYVAKWDRLVETAAKMDRKTVALDMESYAFLRTAERFGLSDDAFVVKCVTDYADQDKDDRIRAWAQVVAGRFFYFMLADWLDKAHLELTGASPGYLDRMKSD